MKPVFQTRFGYPSGNCFAACVASILELGIDEVREGDEIDATMQNNSKWWHGWRDWLNTKGYELMVANSGSWFCPPKGYAIAGGASKIDGLSHSVVFLDGKLAHDPHEGWDGLAEVEDYVIIYPMGVV